LHPSNAHGFMSKKWDVMEDIFNVDIVSYTELSIRMVFSVLIGFMLGFDRAHKDKPLGRQTYIIITVITCLLAIMAQELYTEYDKAADFIQLDLGKIVAGTLTGIGFLGAGAIMVKDKQEEKLIGTATGASIWAAGILGLMLGFGQYLLTFAGFVVILAALTVLPRFGKQED